MVAKHPSESRFLVAKLAAETWRPFVAAQVIIIKFFLSLVIIFRYLTYLSWASFFSVSSSFANIWGIFLGLLVYSLVIICRYLTRLSWASFLQSGHHLPIFDVSFLGFFFFFSLVIICRYFPCFSWASFFQSRHHLPIFDASFLGFIFTVLSSVADIWRVFLGLPFYSLVIICFIFSVSSSFADIWRVFLGLHFYSLVIICRYLTCFSWASFFSV